MAVCQRLLLNTLIQFTCRPASLKHAPKPFSDDMQSNARKNWTVDSWLYVPYVGHLALVDLETLAAPPIYEARPIWQFTSL